METIWKFVFEIKDLTDIEMPEGAELLYTDTQYDIPAIWAIVNPDAKRVHRRIRVAGTEHSNVEGAYVGSFQMHGGQLVWHIFDQGEFPLDT